MKPEREDLSVVTAVVVNWNGAADCIRLMGSLENAFESGMRLILVDNGSVDDSRERLRQFMATFRFGERVELVETGDNVGFTAGVNAGTERALTPVPEPEFLLLLNPDGTAERSLVGELVSVARASCAEIVFAPQYQEQVDAWPRILYARSAYREVTSSAGLWRLCGRYSGACVLFRTGLVRRLIQEDGFLLDPGLFMYWDEWDASLRARRLGARIALARDASFAHAGPAPSPGVTPFRRYYHARNPLLLARRNLPASRFWGVLVVRVGRGVTWNLRRMRRRRRTAWRALVQGTWDGVRGNTGRWKHHPRSREEAWAVASAAQSATAVVVN
jgi:GT2 family glycosyltransferase